MFKAPKLKKGEFALIFLREGVHGDGNVYTLREIASTVFQWKAFHERQFHGSIRFLGLANGVSNAVIKKRDVKVPAALLKGEITFPVGAKEIVLKSLAKTLCDKIGLDFVYVFLDDGESYEVRRIKRSSVH